MKLYEKRFSGHFPAVILLSSVLLSACGQTGQLYMPKTHSTPPSPEKSQTKKEAQKPSRENAENDTENADKGK